MIAAFKSDPATPVMSPSKGDLLVALGAGRAATWDLPAAAYYCLGEDRTERDRETRVMLLTWARVMALDGGGEASLRSICADRGWDFGTFKRRVDVARQRMADTLEVARLALGSQILLDGEPNTAVPSGKSGD